MTAAQLYERIKAKKTMLCVGLDTDYLKLPSVYRETPTALGMFDFNRLIIDATAPYCVAYKPNLAFYEVLGSMGLRVLEMTVDYIRSKYPDQFLIADAKRGDIGNTAKMYAETYFKSFDVDAVTLSPYMGRDTVIPFLQYKGKFAIVVALSSNRSSSDYQTLDPERPLYRKVITDMMEISTPDNMMFVVGATKAEKLREIRELAPDNFYLVPGVGAQGGSAEEVIKYGSNSQGGLLINSSRAILYASSGIDFEEAAARVAAATARYEI